MGGKHKRKENSKSQRKKKNYQALLIPLTEEEQENLTNEGF